MDWMEHITNGAYMKYYETMYGNRGAAETK